MKTSFSIVSVILIACLPGCLSSRQFVSIEEKFRDQKYSSGFHQVQKGETLFAIAWRYGLDFHELANANFIESPYTIYPGQRIDIRDKAKAQTVVSQPNVKKSSTAPYKQPRHVSRAPQRSHNSPKSFGRIQTNDWSWPVNGRLISRFSTNKPVNKGIDIAGSMGESVSAAAAGTVVYAGTGLRGYGNLVIIKHDDLYLSAYAHASRILVQEQEIVKAGQTIAEIGSTGTDKVKLHFEIRKNGKPVDPLKLLPSSPE